MKLQIDPMTIDDIGFAVSMTDYEAWGNIPADFGRLIAHEPRGCFIAREGDTEVGMITTTSSAGYGFMGSLIVKSEYRGQGVGKALMMKGIDYLKSLNAGCIELDATFEGVPLYRKLGFQDKYLSFRLRRATGVGKPVRKDRPDFIASEIVSFDSRCVGFDRSRLLKRLLGEFRESVFVCKSDRIEGYAIVYPRAGKLLGIGPVVADSLPAAESLLGEITEAFASYDLTIGVPETAHEITPYLLSRGFEYRPPSLRMYLGDRREYEKNIYAIVSPEKG